MAKEIDKIIQSKTAPKSNNVLWDDGKDLKINRNSKWESTGGGAPMINITYANLVELRNNNKLIAGMQYRITDYVTTTAQTNTRSAGHQFDVIVTADNENTLNEVARACLHEGDTYFSEAGANLAAWQIWYSLDNDTERFAWADTENGKGIIYRMIDEWNNDIPYDFKNIIYVETFTFECSQYGIAHTYTKNGNVINIDSVEYYGYTRTRTGQGPPPPPEVLYITDEMPTPNSIIYTIEGSVATPYSSATIDSASQKSGEYYTFSANGKEATAISNTECCSNIIRAYYENGLQQRLNKIVFAGTINMLSCYSNYFGYNCYSNYFGYNCYLNVFDNNCNNNRFGNSCYNNILRNNCSLNSFDGGCCNNILGNNCRNNIISVNCNNNTFGNSCYNNILTGGCYDNSFSNNCNNVEISEYITNKIISINTNREIKVFNLADLVDLLNS